MADVGGVLALAKKLHREGRLIEAERLYQQVLALAPKDAEAWHLRGLLAHDVGQLGAALEYMQRAVELKPDFVEALYNLGVMLERLGRLEEAAGCYLRAIAISPARAAIHVNLGNVLNRQRKSEEAIGCYRRAIELEPDNGAWHFNLGLILQEKGAAQEAAESYGRTIVLRPDLAQGHNNLATLFMEQRQWEAAEGFLEEAIRHNPNFAEAHNNMGIVWRGMARLPESNAAIRRAIAIKPDFELAQSNFLYGLYFCPEFDAAAIAEEHRRWNEQRAAPLAKLIRPWANEPLPQRRLRIGYVSPDFRDHCQSFFTIPLLTHHDREHFELFCYSSAARPDPITNRLRSLADQWREIAGMSDEEAAEIVRQDKIDVLVDLVLHMGGGRPLLFARKPAPVQACWLGYPGTSGLTTMDYRLTDPYLDPPGMFDGYYSEESIRLPHSFWCYDPLSDVPDVNRLPALENGYVTFGCLNNFCKVNEGVLRLWAGVMRAVPNSRLMLLAPDGATRQRVQSLLSSEGVDAKRVSFVSYQPRASYLATYHQIDIGLETLPANGHTTSLDAFWMGVPVPTVVGRTAIGRAGVCLLENLGLPELIAQTPEQYVQVVSDLAGDWDRLGGLRGTLRERMRRSPLMDGAQFTKDMEAAYRMMWKRWCGGQCGGGK